MGRKQTSGSVKLSAQLDQAIAWVQEHAADLRRIAEHGPSSDDDEDLARRACGLVAAVCSMEEIEIDVWETDDEEGSDG